MLLFLSVTRDQHSGSQRDRNWSRQDNKVLDSYVVGSLTVKTDLGVIGVMRDLG